MLTLWKLLFYSCIRCVLSFYCMPSTLLGFRGTVEIIQASYVPGKTTIWQIITKVTRSSLWNVSTRGARRRHYQGGTTANSRSSQASLTVWPILWNLQEDQELLSKWRGRVTRVDGCPVSGQESSICKDPKEGRSIDGAFLGGTEPKSSTSQCRNQGESMEPEKMSWASERTEGSRD